MNADHTETPDPSPAPPPAQRQPPEAASPAVGCTPSFAELFRYMDDFLEAEPAADVHSHLEACRPCGDLYHFQTSFRHMIELRCRVDLPPDLPNRIFRAITEHDGPLGRSGDSLR